MEWGGVGGVGGWSGVEQNEIDTYLYRAGGKSQDTVFHNMLHNQIAVYLASYINMYIRHTR